MMAVSDCRVSDFYALLVGQSDPIDVNGISKGMLTYFPR